MLFRVSSFLNPPVTISTPEEFTNSLSLLNSDEYLIITYLPTEESYLNQIQPNSSFDTFSTRKRIEFQQQRQAYFEEKYSSGSRKNLFLIVEDSELARALKLNTAITKIGERVIFAKANENRGMEVSMQLQGQKYTVRKIPPQLRAQKDMHKVDLHTNCYINEINYEPDMKEFLRKLEWAGEDRKVLVVSCREQRAELKQNVKETLLKVAKMMRKDVLIVTTDNEKILKNCLQIEADNFVTVRLLEPRASQPPLMVFSGLSSPSRPNFYNRWNLSGPFSVENICKFIKNCDTQPQYYEQKNNLPTIPASLEQSPPMPDRFVFVLHEKSGCKGCEVAKSYL